MPNSKLLAMELDCYYPQAHHSSYRETLLNSLHMFMTSIDDIKKGAKARIDFAHELMDKQFRTLLTERNVSNLGVTTDLGS